MEGKSPEHRYKGENLILFRANYIKTKYNQQNNDADLYNPCPCNLHVYCRPYFDGWASGYLDMRSMYDVQVYSRYNDVYEEENLPQDSYEIITDFLTEHK